MVTLEEQSGDVEAYFVNNAVNIPQKCTNELTDDTNKLFNSRPNVGDGELVAYFVKETNPPFWGCTLLERDNSSMPSDPGSNDAKMGISTRNWTFIGLAATGKIIIHCYHTMRMHS